MCKLSVFFPQTNIVEIFASERATISLQRFVGRVEQESRKKDDKKNHLIVRFVIDIEYIYQNQYLAMFCVRF